MEKAKRAKGEVLDAAGFTQFMGTYHDENQHTIGMEQLTMPEEMKVEV